MLRPFWLKRHGTPHAVAHEVDQGMGESETSALEGQPVDYFWDLFGSHAV